MNQLNLANGVDMDRERQSFEDAYFNQYPNVCHANPNKLKRAENGDYIDSAVFVAWDMYQIAIGKIPAQTSAMREALEMIANTGMDARQCMQTAQRALDAARTATTAQVEPFGMYVERDDGTREFQRTGQAFQPTAHGYKFWTLYAGAAPAAIEQNAIDAERWRAVASAPGDLTLRLHYSRPEQRAAVIDAARGAASGATK